MIRFGQPTLGVEGNAKRPQLTMFEHVEGARVSAGLFDNYALPSGKSVFYHYTDGSLANEREFDPLPTPPRPTSIPTALQQGMPLTHILDIIAKPPGTGVVFVPHRPVPRLVPLPTKHSLPVKSPESFDADTFSDLREHNVRICLEATAVQETRTTTTVERLDRAPSKEPWSLPTSIFKPRTREADARDFFDTPKARLSTWSFLCERALCR